MEHKNENPYSDITGEDKEAYYADLLSKFDQAVDRESRQSSYLQGLLSE